MTATVWTWRLEDTRGNLIETDALPSSGLPTRAEAEAFLSESWAELADAGVQQVVLLEGDREVYGPMSLEAG